MKPVETAYYASPESIQQFNKVILEAIENKRKINHSANKYTKRKRLTGLSKIANGFSNGTLKVASKEDEYV